MNDKPITQEMLNSAERSESVNDYHRSLQSETYERAWFILNKDDEFLSDMYKTTAMWTRDVDMALRFSTWREAANERDHFVPERFWQGLKIKYLPVGLLYMGEEAK